METRPDATTIDGILGNRLKIEQPRHGFRVAVDTILLAASVELPENGMANVLDLGCGVGGAMLALGCRVPNTRVTGIEIQPDLARLCEGNIRRNAMESRMGVECRDGTRLLLEMREAFDCVMINPPYHDGDRHNASSFEGKRMANTESLEAPLGRWLESAFFALCAGGRVTVIHRADRLPGLCEAAKEAGFGGMGVLPVLPRTGSPPKRILFTATKGGEDGVGAKLREAAPLVLHGENDKYTAEAEDILRHAKGLEWKFVDSSLVTLSQHRSP